MFSFRSPNTKKFGKSEAARDLKDVGGGEQQVRGEERSVQLEDSVAFAHFPLKI